jgi:hypothetical protein
MAFGALGKRIVEFGTRSLTVYSTIREYKIGL